MSQAELTNRRILNLKHNRRCLLSYQQKEGEVLDLLDDELEAWEGKRVR